MRDSDQRTYDVKDRQHVHHEIGDIDHPEVKPTLVRGLRCALRHRSLGPGERASEFNSIVRRSGGDGVPSFVLHGEKGRFRCDGHEQECGSINTSYSDSCLEEASR